MELSHYLFRLALFNSCAGEVARLAMHPTEQAHVRADVQLSIVRLTRLQHPCLYIACRLVVHVCIVALRLASARCFGFVTTVATSLTYNLAQHLRMLVLDCGWFAALNTFV